MYKNYFFLNRFIVEINSFLKKSLLISAFSQEKDKLVLEIKKDSGTGFLEISVNPGFPYINLKDSYHRAKKNTVDFFTEFLPVKILRFEIAGADRIIRLKLENGILYFTVRGKYTNISLHTGNKLQNFKHPPEDFDEAGFLKEMDSYHFTESFNLPDIILDKDADTWNELRRKYPFIGKEIISEIKTRIREENKVEIIPTLIQIIKEIFEEKPAVFLDQNNLAVHLGVFSFKSFYFTEKIFFEDLLKALNFFISKKINYDLLAEKKKKIQKHLDKELSHFSEKLNKLKDIVERGSKEEEYQRLGNLLLIKISSIHKGMKSIEVEDIYNENKTIIIKLDENLKPKQNVDKYFDRAKNDRIRLEKSKQLFKNTLKTFDRLKRIEQNFFSAKDPEDFNKIMEELNIKKEESSKHYQDDIQYKFKHYLIEKKYNVYVGKNNSNNDLLTLKFAKQNDYWFHARSVPGSHVVLRVENTKDIIPKNILKKAASLAAYHSKAKTAGTVPVSYTFKKYVVKKKGMEAGKVALLREDTLLVKPEIPAQCEFIEKD